MCDIFRMKLVVYMAEISKTIERYSNLIENLTIEEKEKISRKMRLINEYQDYEERIM